LITGKTRNFEFVDIFFATCSDLLGELVTVTLSSGKVYVGILLAATEDPNETRRFLKFAPVLEGYCKNDTKLLSYAAFYEPTPDAHHSILVSADQLSSLAWFDWEQFDRFVDDGTITLELKQTMVRPNSR